LTREPAAVTENDILTLRTHGFDDRAIHDATQVIAYFNYINRVAEGLNVELEPFIRPWESSSQPLTNAEARPPDLPEE
jgi:hypothetical protein